jgi:hypothetical protein
VGSRVMFTGPYGVRENGGRGLRDSDIESAAYPIHPLRFATLAKAGVALFVRRCSPAMYSPPKALPRPYCFIPYVEAPPIKPG